MVDRIDAILREEIDDLGATIRDRIPSAFRRLLPAGIAAITLGRTVWIVIDPDERSQEWLDCLIRHELTHVGQYRELGVFRFLFRYCGEYLSHRTKGLGHEEAYRAISFEIAARRAETDVRSA